MIENLPEAYREEYFPGILHRSQGKMAIILFLLLSALVYGTSTVSIMPELKQNVLRFGYGVNFRYEGMLAHSFDRFYVVTRIENT